MGLNQNLSPVKPFPVEEYLAKAQKGDAATRESLLENSKFFIHKVACRYCYKQLQWGQDEELSIALIAFDEAIDKYNEEKKVPFLVFARLVIRNRLIDFLRQENKQSRASLDKENQTIEENRLALEKYDEEMALRECREEVEQYEVLLTRYNLSLKELTLSTPKHKPVRRYLIKVACLLAGEPKLFSSFIETKRLPLKELGQVSGVPRKTLEKHRKYLAALSLIFGHPEDFTYINSYLKG